MSAPEPIIRAAVVTDAEPIARLQVSAWQAAYAHIIPARALAAMSAAEQANRHRQRLASTDTPVADFVAERAAQVVGWTSLGPVRDDDLDPQSVGEIRAMYADPGAWSTGVGTALMTQALAHLQGRKFAGVVLWVLEANDRARRFYERHAFTPDGARKDIDFGGVVTEVRYRRPLAD